MTIKIAFFDIDGTLKVAGKEGISEKTLYMLRALQKQGIITCMATGRSPITLPHFEGFEFDVHLTFNGSYCFNRENIIFSHPIPKEDVLQILANAKELNRPAVLATSSKLVANGTDADMVEYFALASLEVKVSPEFQELLKDDVYQIMMGSTKAEYEQLMHNAPNAKITTWWPRGVDIIPASTGKGVGVEAILNYYNLTSAEAIAFGDGGNDVDLLKSVGKAVAVANACEELKSLADHICGSVENDGVYHFCVENGLIEPLKE